jgi:hypothetical protein
VLLTVLLLLLAACQTSKTENSRRLLEHPEFPAAARNAPKFTADALKTINALEYELERRKSR